MIVPMQKVCLVVQDKNQEQSLSKLREIGVIHLIKSSATTDTLSKAVERKNRGESALGLILSYKAPKKKKNPFQQIRERRERRTNSSVRRGRRASDLMGVEELEPYSLDAVNAPVRPDLINLMVEMGADRKAMEDRQAVLVRERSRIEPWGEFDPQAVKELAAGGVRLFFYELTPEAFASIPPETRYFKMGGNKTAVYLIVPDVEIPGIAQFQLPEKSFSQLDGELKDLQGKLGELDAKIKTFADRRPILMKDMALIQQDIDFEVARASLEKAEDVPEELGFSWLTGFVPREDLGQLKRAAAENGWALVADEPGPQDEVPTKLKNSSLTRLLYPITNFLELVPGYHEMDISGWFFFFFCIFFGMLFGDAGYGAILFLLAIVFMIKTAKTGVPLAFKTLLVLSLSNLLWGVLTCTWFGAPTEYLPQYLIDISLSYISPAKTAQATVDQNLKLFCFSLGLFQLGIAHIKGVFRNIRSLKFLAEIGSLGMLAGMYNLILFLVVSDDSRIFPMQQFSLYLLAGGFALNFIFVNYQGNILRSILESFKNIISVVLGVTGVFSDIMSYIRLWAVGLAGASIAATINGMAGPMLGNFLMFFGMILLVFGHGMNMMLNVLSVLVHGIRLNTLEFSGHLGLTWCGTAYRPFAETVKK